MIGSYCEICRANYGECSHTGPKDFGSAPKSRVAEVVLIGTPLSDREIERKAEELLDGCIMALQQFDTKTLERISDYRKRVYADGWIQKMIDDYIEVWR